LILLFATELEGETTFCSTVGSSCQSSNKPELSRKNYITSL
jgi:hypothetical protein